MDDIISLLNSALSALNQITVSGLQNHSLVLTCASAVKTAADALSTMQTEQHPKEAVENGK